MLKGIPKILPPALLKAMCEMGHADKLVNLTAIFRRTPSAKMPL